MVATELLCKASGEAGESQHLDIIISNTHFFFRMSC